MSARSLNELPWERRGLQSHRSNSLSPSTFSPSFFLFYTVTLPLPFYFASACFLALSLSMKKSLLITCMFLNATSLSWLLHQHHLLAERHQDGERAPEVWEEKKNLLWPLDIGLRLISLPLCAGSAAAAAFFHKEPDKVAPSELASPLPATHPTDSGILLCVCESRAES